MAARELSESRHRYRSSNVIVLAVMTIAMLTIVATQWYSLKYERESQCRSRIVNAYETQFRHNIGVWLDTFTNIQETPTAEEVRVAREAAANMRNQPDPFVEQQREC